MPDWIEFPKNPKSILNPFEQRILGIVQIAEGIGQVILGKYSPNLVLPWIKKKGREKWGVK